MQFTLAAVLAFVAFAVAQDLKECRVGGDFTAADCRQALRDACNSQACIDAVDDGCPINSINFNFGCDENGAGQ